MNHQILGFPNQLQQPLPQPLPPILSEAFILFSPLRKAAPSAPLRRLELLSHGNETHSCGAPSSCCSQQPSGWANIESPSGDFFRWKKSPFYALHHSRKMANSHLLSPKGNYRRENSEYLSLFTSSNAPMIGAYLEVQFQFSLDTQPSL